MSQITKRVVSWCEKLTEGLQGGMPRAIEVGNSRLFELQQFPQQFRSISARKGHSSGFAKELQEAAVEGKCKKFDMVAWGGQSNSKHSRPAIFSSFLILLVVVYFTSVLLWPPDVPALQSPAHRAQRAERLVQRELSPFSAPVQKLLKDLKEASRVAAESGGLPFSYTKEERSRWRSENPCRARSELPHLYAQRESTNVKRNHQWEAVLDEYSTLHRTCTRKIANLTDYFLKGSTVPGCKFLTGESLFGLGNKITYAASVVLYGILTQRVVLFYEWNIWIPAVMCEPFEGSSWKLPYDLEYLNRRKLSPTNFNEVVISNSTEKFLAWVDREKKVSPLSGSTHQSQIYQTEIDDGWQPVDRFFCDSEQEFLSRVRWVSMAGCLYFMPKLFAITSFRPTLEALFPDRMALTHVLRSVFLPYNVAWDRIQRQNEMLLSQADKRVSIQVRYRLSWDEYSKLKDSVNEQTIRCLLDNKILPNISDDAVHSSQNSKYAAKMSKPSITKVLITSLYADMNDLLQSMYLRYPTESGESVGFFQLTHDSDQQWGFEPDTQALVEIILLSLADQILVTPLSTFGGVAQAYGGLKPWIVEHTDNNLGSCVRASSVDLCYQKAKDTFSCPHNPEVHNKKVYEHVPYLEKCLAIDSPSGLVLITRRDQNMSGN